MKTGYGMVSWLAERRTRYWLRTCDAVGFGAVLDGKPTIGNSGRIRIGRRFAFASVPAPSHMVTGPKGTIEIGDDVSIGHGAAVASFVGLTIGSGSRIAPFVIIMDTDFHAAGDRSSEAQSGPIAIGAGVRIGSHVTVLRGSEIGDDAVVAAGSVVSGKVPRGAHVSGVPAREGLRGEGGHEGDRVIDRVPLLIQHSLGLVNAPGLDHRPSEIPQWDSLGALRLLLALEETFGVTLSEDEVLRVSSIADLASLVERAVSVRVRCSTEEAIGHAE